MIRGFHLADFFTLANAACGVARSSPPWATCSPRSGRSSCWAAALLPVALVFDVLDGRIARWRQRHSPLGRELDSLADVISFGVAPAALAFAAGMQSRLDRAVLIYFVACGVSRLARYNVTAEELAGGRDKVKYFEGTPIPTSVLLVVVLAAGRPGGGGSASASGSVSVSAGGRACIRWC